MLETLLGGLLGGVFRIVPEFLKLLDAKNERKHELDMQDKALEFQKLQGEQKLSEITAQGQQDWNVGSLDALKSAIKTQVKTGVKWVDALSATVRPVVTYWFMSLYCLTKVAAFALIIQQGGDWISAVHTIWTTDDMALFAGIMNFWFLGRVFDKVR